MSSTDSINAPSNDDKVDDTGDSTTESNPSKEHSRDEVEEIRKLSQKETSRVKTWRLLVFLALLATAVCVTATTYVLLKKQEHENFTNVYSQFARTVADSAIAQQTNLKDALESFSDTMSELATLSGDGNSNWPLFIPPKFETFAQHYKNMSSAEFVGITNIVTHDQRETYSSYIDTQYQEVFRENHMIKNGNLDFLNNDTAMYHPFITKKEGTLFVADDERESYIVRTIQSPPPRAYGPSLNWNLASDPAFEAYMNAAIVLRNEITFSEIRKFIGLAPDEHKGFHSVENEDNPHTFGFYPVFKVAGDKSSDIVAVLATAIAFDASMVNLLPDNVKGMMCIVQNNCGQSFSYIIDGRDAIYQDMSDMHDSKYDEFAVSVNLTPHGHPDFATTPGHCIYSMNIYPTEEFENDYKTKTPAIFAGVVAATFVLVALVFLVYDTMVLKRNEMLVSSAARTNAIVTSFVPDHLRDRLMNHQDEQKLAKQNGNLKTFLNDGTKKPGGENGVYASAPLADLFLDTTVLFADISGFTAWSSVREPSQVFTLLETLYGAFDQIAKKRRVFKVETVGDCYVAVCGLPDPRKDHAVCMARFARDILQRMHVLTKELEVTLGPDTGELALRVGMHSGPVTAGVLRGERARFQLFGDTMNTCARVESSSQPNRIQCSEDTAEKLIQAGKAGWLQKRTEAMPALKGKGSLECYWLNVYGERAGSVASGYSSQDANNKKQAPVTATCFKLPGLDERTSRLIDWNVEMLLKLMQAMEAQRLASNTKPSHKGRETMNKGDKEGKKMLPLDEVREIISLPEFDVKAARKQVSPDQIKIPDEVVKQLHHLVSSIANLYNANPFHNFDHASHVVMSVIKLMNRIIGPSHLLDAESHKDAAASLHDHSYGITSDPLTQFACAFSALIHDVDHVGVSNAQLVKEGVPIAKQYQERSVAEQNSLDISWEALMRPDYAALRNFLFPTPTDLTRFRQLVVNSVMSTDIVDKDLKALRNARWEKAFKKGGDETADNNPRDEVNRKATIVIEHIIQASDVSHTMQHWHVYRKWNQNLFDELYVAYLNGRMEKDPAEFWYKGEIGFFDFYIIPLTQKLKECGVFGVSSGEYLDYATKNRNEWETRGQEIVTKIVQEARAKYGVKEEGPNGKIILQDNSSSSSSSSSSTAPPSDVEC